MAVTLLALLLAMAPPQGIAGAADRAKAGDAAAGNQEIIVRGQGDRKAMRDAAYAYVKQVRIAAGMTALARWQSPVCPEVLGLPPEQSLIVEGRLRDVVKRVGAPLAKRDCAANFTVAFSAQPKGLVRQVGALSSGALRELGQSARMRTLEGDDPIRWWYRTEAKSDDGVAKMYGLPPFVELNGPAGSQLPGAGDRGTLLGYGNNSIINTQAVRVITDATVVIDARAIDIAHLSSAADYAAMVGLVELSIQSERPATSVLAMFDQSAAAPQALTPSDLAFLQAVYALKLNRPARVQRLDIVARMTRTRVSLASER